MSTRFILHVDEDGKLSLPPEVRAAWRLQEGDTLELLQTGEQAWLLLPSRLLTPDFAATIEKWLAEKNIDLATWLADGAEIRAALFAERYGHLIQPE